MGGTGEPCSQTKHSARTFVCQEGCDETLCQKCCTVSLTGKKCCKMCKIRVDNKANMRKAKSTVPTGGNAMLDLDPSTSSDSSTGTSKALGGFRKTSELKVDQNGVITGWESLWKMVEEDDAIKQKLKARVEKDGGSTRVGGSPALCF